MLRHRYILHHATNRTTMGKIVVYCQPGAKKTQLVGWHDGKPKIQLKAPPVDGEANKALVAYLAELCGVPRNQVDIELGTASRTKRVAVEGVSSERLTELLTAPAP
jgi:uncharacterized protein (TIGR00251 family)